MRLRLLFLEAFSVFLWLCFSITGLSEDLPRTWHEIESEILASKMFENPSGTLKRHWTNSQALVSLVANRDRGALIRLAAASTNPIVMLSSYYALRQIETEHRALDLGIALALRDDVTNFFPLLAMGQVIEDHTNGVSASSFKSSLSRATRMLSVNMGSANLLVERLSPRLLRDWFEDPSRSPSNIDFEAFVAWQLLKTSRKQPEIVSPKLVSTMQGFARLPGAPRYVYLMWMEPESSPRFKELLVSVLEDPSIPNGAVMSLALKSKHFIKSKLDLGELHIEQYRMGLIRQQLAQ